MSNEFDEMVADGFDTAFDTMAELVEYRADKNSDYKAVFAIVQGERTSEEFTASGTEQKKTRVASFIVDDSSRFCCPLPIRQYGTMIYEGVLYTAESIENKAGIVDVTFLHVGIAEWSKEDFRR